MKYYIVSFDRSVGKTYRAFHDEFVGHAQIRRWCHYIQSSYIVGTEMTSSELATHFRSTAKKHALSTRHVVLRVDLSDRAGWLPKEAWDWFRKQLKS